MYEIFQKYLDSKIVLAEEEAALIRSFAVVKRLRKKQFLLQEGEVWKHNAFVTSGCLRTFSINEKGYEHAINFAVENWWIGDRESLMSGQPSLFNIDAVENSTVVLINKTDFETICKSVPSFNNMVNDILQKSFVASQSRIHAAISFTAEEKYLHFLKRYPDFALRIPQGMIASYLGITPETLSRIRNQVSRKNTH